MRYPCLDCPVLDRLDEGEEERLSLGEGLDLVVIADLAVALVEVSPVHAPAAEVEGR